MADWVISALPRPFVPSAKSEAVRKLQQALGAEKTAVTVKVVVESGGRERDCYVNVRVKAEREGGKMQLGWAVWQHADLFIEAEPHAVFDPGEGKPWVDCTPHAFPDGSYCKEILFIPNDRRSYDFNTTDVPDNVRIPLIDDPRVAEALRLHSERTKLMNGVPGVDITLPIPIQKRIAKLNRKAAKLLSDVMQPPVESGLVEKLGRNDPCPCGSGLKYKKCHGAVK